ncbi:antibiotic biosynthesis monooxygenase [Humitalea sp. 24SJ18S-53]|uniref:antibiotic biosynthesis monooxygenase n=1 Tax=Humitalea sp. 24SJ18S-53 TaxID=3422307 RepID=UPI003D6793B4
MTNMPAVGSVTVVVQTRPRDGAEAAFVHWQAEIGAATAAQPGFLEQTVQPANPPAQMDWVILQRFKDMETAVAWLNSARRLELVTRVQPLLIGVDDVHIVSDIGAGALPAPVSAVFSTRLKPGAESAFRVWQQRVAAAQSRAPGFQGYRFEPPIPGVQDDWIAILRFDSERNLQGWMESPARLALLTDAEALVATFHTRIIRTAFDRWFESDRSNQLPPPAWKQNLIVLAMLYPVVFLFGLTVQAPVLSGWFGLPAWLTLFIANIVSVLLLNTLVPWAGHRLDWWLHPAVPAQRRRVNLYGLGLILAVCAGWLTLFSFLG